MPSASNRWTRQSHAGWRCKAVAPSISAPPDATGGDGPRDFPAREESCSIRLLAMPLQHLGGERPCIMIDIRRILCPIDFSDCSRRALDHAVAIAKWYDATITLVHVSPIVPIAAYAPGSGVVPSANLSPDEREALLTSMKQLAAVEGGSATRFDYILAEGGTAAQILNAADTLASGLVVIGTHGRSGFERLMLGSVTERVLRKATCPVLSVPPHSTDAVPLPPLFRHILCAVDFSECSIHALEYAMSLAQESGGHLMVLHVIDVGPEIPDIHGLMIGGVPDVREFIARVDEAARARLKDLIPDSVRTSCTVETMVVTGRSYREVLRVAGDWSSDLIVLGVHGRGPVDRLFFGSTAQQVVREATCPVLTLRK
jgi:nucleotide-binding universal stress UspA family protein